MELRSREMTCVSDDGDASVIVLRKLGHDFATEVTWSTRDGDALAGDHYTSEGGWYLIHAAHCCHVLFFLYLP